PVATRWLLSSCTVGDARVDAELRSAGAPAADTLLRAYRNGSGRLADDVETNAGKEYDRIIDALDHGRTYGLSPAEVSDVRRETRAVHMRHARDLFDASYREAALTGLAVIGRPQDVAFIQRIARQPSADAEAAASALDYAGLPR